MKSASPIYDRQVRPMQSGPILGQSAHIAKVKSAMLRATHDTLDAEGFTQIIAPVLTSLSGACGDPGTLIPVALPGRQSYLRQTCQLHLEPLMRELGRVYSVGHSFRAERHASDRHLTEFTLIEAEVAEFDLNALMELVEQLVCDMVDKATVSVGHHLAALGAKADDLRFDRPFARMTYDEAIIALQKQGFFIEWGEDLANTHELALTEIAGGPLFVTHYPVELRFFTMKVRRSDPRVAECFDLLLPGVGEVLGGSETEADPDLLERKLHSSRSVRQLVDLGTTIEDYNWYIEMHKEQNELAKPRSQQAGFGMGFERLVRYVCGLSSVAQAAV
jgi:asparaginyl-tRNA synthetase